jgi:rod shape-determining protein MreD
MKTKLIIGIILVFLVILQSTTLDYLKLFNTKPDLVLIAIVLIALSLKFKWVMLFSYLAGFIKDTLATQTIGLNTLVLPLIGFLVFRLSKKIDIDSDFMKSALIFMATFLENLLIWFLLIFLGTDISLGIFSRFALIGSIYTALLFLLFSKKIITPKLSAHS